MRLAALTASLLLTTSVAFAGALTGRITSDDKTRSDYSDIEVYIPGTSCMSRTDRAGNFSLDLSKLPWTDTRDTTLVAYDPLNSKNHGRLPVRVSPNSTLANVTLSIAPLVPTITSLSPAEFVLGSPSAVTITGTNFQASTARTYEVRIDSTVVGGKAAPDNPLSIRKSDTQMVIPASALARLPEGTHQLWLSVDDVPVTRTATITVRQAPPPPPPPATRPATTRPTPPKKKPITPGRTNAKFG